jgi:hypothetical protein
MAVAHSRRLAAYGELHCAAEAAALVFLCVAHGITLLVVDVSCANLSWQELLKT